MTVKDWVPPESGLDRKNLPLWNTAMSYLGANIPLLEPGSSLRLTLIARPHLEDPVYALSSPKGQTLYLHIETFPYRQLFEVDFDLNVARTLPPGLASAIYAGTVEFLVRRFPDMLTSGMSLQDVCVDEISTTEHLHWFAATIDGLAETSVLIYIGATASDICSFLKEKIHQPRSGLMNVGRKLKVDIYRVIGRANVNLDAVCGISVGDFLVLENAVTSELTIRSDDHAYCFKPEEERWLCTAIRSIESTREMTTMDNAFNHLEDSVEVVADPPVDKGEDLANMATLVSTTLTFECGRTRVTLAELEGFRVGAIVSLPDQLTSDSVQVTIRAGDQSIATGEVIQIDDRIAVMVNRLLIHDKP